MNESKLQEKKEEKKRSRTCLHRSTNEKKRKKKADVAVQKCQMCQIFEVCESLWFGDL